MLMKSLINYLKGKCFLKHIRNMKNFLILAALIITSCCFNETQAQCNLIVNGSFENGASCGIVPPSGIAPVGQISNWTNQLGTPDIFVNGVCGTDAISSQFELNTNHTRGSSSNTLLNALNGTHILGFQSTPIYHEGISQQMSSSLTFGKYYRLSFSAIMGDDIGYYGNVSNPNFSSSFSFYVGGATIPTPDNSGVASIQQQATTANLQLINTITVKGLSWSNYSYTFTYNGTLPSYNRLYISTNTMAGQLGNYVYLENLSLVEIPQNITGKTSLCVGATTTLASATTGGTWSSSNTAVATINATTGVASGVAVGNAIITYTVPNFSGNCTGTTTFNLSVKTCTPCEFASSTAPQIGSVTNTIISNGNYSGTTSSVYTINNNILFTGNTTFTKCEVIVAPNVTVTIAQGATVTLDGAHFYSCTNMWNGFEVMPSGRMISKNESLIEDAWVGISFSFPTGTANYINGTNLLSVDRTTFNRNDVGIKIDNYQNDVFGNPTFPFYVNRSIFTSRDIPFNPGAINWHKTYNIGAKTSASIAWIAPNPPVSLASPFINPITYKENIRNANNTAFLKINATIGQPQAPRKPSAGILLNNIGTSINLNSNISLGRVNPNASEISDPAVLAQDANFEIFEFNLFDNLNIGIDATNANLHVNNSVFQKPHISCINRTGIKLNGESYRQVYVDNDPIGTNPAPFINNSFFDMQLGIDAYNYSHFNVNGAFFRSGQSKINRSGFTGIFLDGENYVDVNIISDSFNNVDNGITINYLSNLLSLPPDYNQPSAYFFIAGNRMANVLTGLSPTGNEYVQNAITFNGHDIGDPDYDNQSLICTQNVLTNVYNGISVIDLKNKGINISWNNIKLTQVYNDPSPTVPKFGISLSGGSAGNNIGTNFVQMNTIEGDCITCEQSGIYISSEENAYVGCNTVKALHHGIRFNGYNVGVDVETRCWDNNIYPTNRYGFTLENNGIIGLQGVNYTYNGITYKCTSDNNWINTAPTWKSFNPWHYMTNVNSSFAYKSPFMVKPNTSSFISNPVGSGNSNFGSTFPIYQNGTTTTTTKSIIVGNGTGNLNCWHCSSNTASNPVQQQNNNEEAEVMVLEDIVEGTMELGDDEPDQRLYALQQEVFEQLKKGGSKYANNQSLQEFIQNNQWSSFDYIYYVKKFMAKNNEAMVQLLMANFPSNNIVDDNYFAYYNMVHALKTDSTYVLDTVALFGIANQCAQKHGKVVYAARALYNKITKTTNVFRDECEQVGGGVASRKAPVNFFSIAKVNNNYIAYPNPTTSVFYVNNKDIKTIKIYDITGRLVKQQDCIGIDLEQVDVNKLTKGLYIMQLQKMDGNTINSKLIKK